VSNSRAASLLRGTRLLSNGRRRREARAAPQAGPRDLLGQVEFNADLSGALARLNPRQQEAVYLHYREDLSPAGIAVRMGITRQAVEKLLRNAFKSLRVSPRLVGWAEEEDR
jgi:RNA polymerase sigma factor (sigma-70 family)